MLDDSSTTEEMTSQLVGRIRSWIDGHRLISFFLIAFGWTWSWHFLVYLVMGPSPPSFPHPWVFPSTWGPLIAATVVISSTNRSVWEWLRGVIKIPSRLWLLAIAFVTPVVLAEIGALLAVTVGYSLSWPILPVYAYPGGFLLVFFFGGALEEFGWRAFAQPGLQQKYPPTVVALGIGAIWATWHLPLFLLMDLSVYDPANLPIYYLSLMFDSVFLAWLFNTTKGSVLAPMVFHASGNMASIFDPSGTPSGVLGLVADNDYLFGILTVAVIVVVVTGLRLSSDKLPRNYPIRLVG